MNELLLLAVGFAVGVAATLGASLWSMRRARKRLDAKLRARGKTPPRNVRPRVAEDPGGGQTYCVKLNYNPYFSYYCVDVTTGYAWYVPR